MCWQLLGRSIIYTQDNKGPGIDSWETPHTLAAQQENASPISTLWYRLLTYERNQSRATLLLPYCTNFISSRSWSIVSNASLMSRRMQQHTLFLVNRIFSFELTSIIGRNIRLKPELLNNEFFWSNQENFNAAIHSFVEHFSRRWQNRDRPFIFKHFFDPDLCIGVIVAKSRKTP